MIFSLRTHALITLALLAALTAVGWGGAGLAQASGVEVFSEGRRLVMGVVFGLFLLLGLSLPPLVVKTLLAAHRKAGDGDKPMARGLAASERSVIYAAWALMLAGAVIAVPAAIRGGLFEAQVEATPR